LGHSTTALYPALAPLVLDSSIFHAQLSGLSHPAELSTFVDGKLSDRRTGSLLWTHFGISGPVVLDASRHWTVARGEGRAVELRCNLLPGRTFDDVDRSLQQDAAAHPRRQVTTQLSDELPERLAEAVVAWAGIDPTTPLGQLTRESRRRLSHALTGLVLPVVRDRGWNYAEVTAGGVPLKEVDFRTMQSRKVEGLHLIGEMLDCDGRIGGFNFQWAWSTGYIAGRAVATSLAS
jgi:predicted Rossmann fold flavoprotein